MFSLQHKQVHQEQFTPYKMPDRAHSNFFTNASFITGSSSGRILHICHHNFLFPKRCNLYLIILTRIVPPFPPPALAHSIVLLLVHVACTQHLRAFKSKFFFAVILPFLYPTQFWGGGQLLFYSETVVLRVVSDSELSSFCGHSASNKNELNLSFQFSKDKVSQNKNTPSLLGALNISSRQKD